MIFYCDVCGYAHEGNTPPERCPKCRVPKSYFSETNYEYELKKISNDEAFINAMKKLHDEDPIEYQLKLNQLKIQQEQKVKIQKVEEKNVPKCPHCQSTNIKKIDVVDRAVSILGLGIFSKKINKSFKCNSCGYTW